MGDKRRPGPLESSLSKKPPKEYSTPPQARGLHPPGALTRTSWQVEKCPRRFYSNRPRARGLLSGTNTRVPEEEELITINVDPSERSRARLHLLLGSASVDTKAVGSISPDPRGRAPPRLTSAGWLRLARCLRACSASLDG